MNDATRTAADYLPEDVALVRSVCLTIATVLGDLVDEDIVFVGGFVPSLLIPRVPAGVEPHVGTRDADIGISMPTLSEGRYEQISKSLRDSGFEPDKNDKGRPTPQRWRHTSLKRIVIDFLIPVVNKEGVIFWMEDDFAAIQTKALPLAFSDRRRVTLEGLTLSGAKATREVWCCGPGAFIVMKALAHKRREKPKDAYDLWFMATYFGRGPAEVADTILPYVREETVIEAIALLQSDFADVDRLGPVRAAYFLRRAGDAAFLQQVVASISVLLTSLQPK